jgi:hypothetical protein
MSNVIAFVGHAVSRRRALTSPRRLRQSPFLPDRAGAFQATATTDRVCPVVEPGDIAAALRVRVPGEAERASSGAPPEAWRHRSGRMDDVSQLENGPRLLREQAARWRKLALACDPRTAKALTEAARSLEDRAAAADAGSGPV